MMNVSVKIVGLKEVMEMLRDMPVVIQKGLRDAVVKSSLLLEGSAKQLVSNQMVNVRTGCLRSSIRTNLLSSGMVSHIGPHVNYAVYLHEGTKYIRPRPFLERAIDLTHGDVSDIFSSEIRRALSK